jgi:hypothetical protein
MVLSSVMAAVRGIVVLSFICPLVLRDDLLPCVEQMDADLDGSITETEIDAFYAAHSSCLSSEFLGVVTGAQTIAQCDTHADGNLTIADWNSPTGCFQKRSRQNVLCQACNKCNLFPVIVKKKKE